MATLPVPDQHSNRGFNEKADSVVREQRQKEELQRRQTEAMRAQEEQEQAPQLQTAVNRDPDVFNDIQDPVARLHVRQRQALLAQQEREQAEAAVQKPDPISKRLDQVALVSNFIAPASAAGMDFSFYSFVNSVGSYAYLVIKMLRKFGGEDSGTDTASTLVRLISYLLMGVNFLFTSTVGLVMLIGILVVLALTIVGIADPFSAIFGYIKFLLGV